MALNIYDYEENYDLLLCKLSREPVCVVFDDYIESISRYIDDIDKMELSIPKQIVDRFTFKNIDNLTYKECKEERLLLLNEKEYFIIKNDKHSSDDFYKKITAYSLEYKLSKIDINIEDVSFQLMIPEIDKKIYSLNDYMYEETGWKLGHIDDSVRYDISEDGTKTEKLRIQTSISKSWYDFLKNDICVQFGCILEFDTLNKLVNLYDVKTKGEDVQIYLSKDNYITSLENENSSDNIVTRMFVKGNEEMDIIGATPTGYNFIENYSYFIDNHEMSSELENALKTYYQMVEKRTPIWRELVKQKQVKISILNDKKMRLYIVYAKFKEADKQMKYYESIKDDKNYLIAGDDKAKINEERETLEAEIKLLEDEIRNLQSSIDNINILCKYPTSRDEEGNLIFNEKLLNDLKDYIYHDTYSNDSFLKVEDVIQAAKRELDLKCRPTKTYKIGVVDFTKRIISNGFRLNFKGMISLGNIVMLVDPKTHEEFNLFIVSYTVKPNESNGLDIEISDKKVRNDYTRTISDYLNDAKRSTVELNTKKYLLNRVKYQTINS